MQAQVFIKARKAPNKKQKQCSAVQVKREMLLHRLFAMQ